jgi:pimeloyl-ACP methyl ester carboxylesterase
MTRWLGVGVIILAMSHQACGHITGTQEQVTIPCPVCQIGATLTLPNVKLHPGKRTCVLIVGGAHGQTRDGTFLRPGVPLRTDFLTFEHLYCESGFACLRFDQPGFGTSKRVRPWTGSYADKTAVIKSVIGYARQRTEIEKLVILAEDIGAYWVSLAAADQALADAYILVTPTGGTIEEQYAFEYGRIAKLAESDEEFRSFAMDYCRIELALGRQHRELFKAVHSGQEKFLMEDDELSLPLALAHRQEELARPPGTLFEKLARPTLVIGAELDLRTPPEHARRAVDTIRRTGTQDVQLVMLKGTDHFLRRSSGDEKTRVQEFYRFKSFRRPIQGQALDALLRFVEAFSRKTPR